jgi:hypothetical protein
MASGVVEVFCEVVTIVGGSIPAGGDVATLPPVLLGTCKTGAGAAVKTKPPELLFVGDDAGASLGASVVAFTEGERFGEAKGFVEG